MNFTHFYINAVLNTILYILFFNRGRDPERQTDVGKGMR